MKKLLILFACLPLLGACTQTEPVSGNRAAAIVAEIHNPRSKNVVVASHRGDWRNYPENSIAAIESVIGMGVDIMELDLKLTKDSVLVLCHDKTIDRTTSGKGRVCDITYDSIRRCVLRTAHNQKTDLRMPTLREALEVCKDRIVVNIDQGYEYYDLALAVTEELGVTDQVLIKGKRPAEAVAAAARYDRCFVIGGASVYMALLSRCDRVYVTKVDADPDADSFFPNLDDNPDWRIESESETFEENGLKFRYVDYVRK